MDVKYLKYILAIADRKNMTKAAEDLFVSQSSLSQHLSRLEQELGTPLFLRSRGELSLTPAGALYVEAARKVVKIQDELYRNIASLDRRGHINIGVTSNFGLRMLSEIIPEYKKEYPDVSIEISELGLPALKKMIAEDQLDLGIAAVPDIHMFEGQSYVLRQEEVLFAIPRDHPYTKINTTGHLTAAELHRHFSKENFVLSKQGASIRILLDRLFDSIGFTPSAFCEINNIPSIRSMIAHQTGVAFIAQSCAVDREYISYYSLDPPLYRLNVIFNRKDWIRNEAENVFYNYLTRYFEENTEDPYLAEKYPVHHV